MKSSNDTIWNRTRDPIDFHFCRSQGARLLYLLVVPTCQGLALVVCITQVLLSLRVLYGWNF